MEATIYNINPCMRSFYAYFCLHRILRGLLGWHMESNLGCHLVRPEVGGIYENAVVFNKPHTVKELMIWLGMDKDILHCLGAFKMIRHSQIEGVLAILPVT